MLQFLTNCRNRRIAGVSVVEMFLSIAVIGILATLSSLAVTHLNQSVQHRKLESDVHTLNSAIKIYLASGGSLQNLSAPSAVLANLKTSRSKADKELHVGAPSGRMIDPRIAAVPVEEGSGKLRATYNAGQLRFDVTPDGTGVEFVLDEDLAEGVTTIEDRSHGAVNYAENSGWIWDHAATTNPAAPKGPSSFQTNPGIADTDPGTPPVVPDPASVGGGGPSSPPSSPEIPRLPAPTFDKNGGAHSEADFPLLVAITNLPSPTDGDPIYRIGSGTWTPYSGPVSIPMNSQFSAQFLTKDPDVLGSGPERSAYYYPVPESLSGTTEGNFYSPLGGPNLSCQITHQSDRSTHGNPVFLRDGEPINSGDPNVLHFNTPNDPDDARASADYVKISNLTQNIPLEISGVNYRIQLEFGATDSSGFSSQSKFHVYEGATGQGDLLATFLPR